MNKKILIIFILFSFISISTFSQTDLYNKFYKKGQKEYNAGDYLDAYKSFDEAYTYAKKKEHKNNAEYYKNKCIVAAEKQKEELENLLCENEKSAKRTDSVKQILEIAVFEKAANKNYEKDYFKEWNIDEIDTLDLSYSNLVYLPAKVAECKKLKSINLIGNADLDIDSTFSVIVKLPRITDIKISVDSIAQIPEEYIPWVSGIKINQTDLSEFPTDVLQLPNLKYLDISGTSENRNNFAQLPTELFQKTKLEHIILENCNIDSLSIEISNLKNLQTLKLSGNNLSEMPKSISNLQKLTVLGIENNNFDDFPAEICKLKNLRILSCYNNNLTELPEEIKGLTKIRALYLWNNQIHTIPNEICYLENLEDLRLYKNKINDINPRIVCLQKLNYLDLSDNEIEKIPVEIGELVTLNYLSLRSNKISSIPKETTKLSNLRNLDLNNNQITEVPKEIAQMTNLQILSLDSNKIETLPDEITELENLNELNIASNNLKSLPAKMKEMDNLQYVEVVGNEELADGLTDEEKYFLGILDEKEVSKDSLYDAEKLKLNFTTSQMVLIKAGKFTMGSPSSEPERDDDETQHQVTFTYNFLMGIHEVTQGEYESLMDNNPVSGERYGVGDNYPVYYVSWWDAIKYCNALSKKEGFPVAYNETTGDLLDANGNITTDITKVKGYRLPTEAEWEYACRAETNGNSSQPFSTGSNLTTEQANYNGNYPYNRNKKGTYRKKTMEVSSFSPNKWGLYDMHGNVWEWCHDWYRSYSGKVTNPVGASSGSYRVLRGGSWFNLARSCRSAFRRSNSPTFSNYRIGFRIARTN